MNHPHELGTTLANAADQRRSERVCFFLVPVGREQIPVWVFKPGPQQNAIAGLCVNLSAGGIQVLTLTEDPLPEGPLQLQLVVDSDRADSPLGFTAPVQQVWQSPVGSREVLNGFEFRASSSDAQIFLAQFKPSLDRRAWVRCVISAEAQGLNEEPGDSA